MLSLEAGSIRSNHAYHKKTPSDTEIYVLQVRTGRELSLQKELQQYLLIHPDASNKDCIIFPRRELIQRKLGRSYKKIQPLFPGYLFWIAHNPPQDLFREFAGKPNVMYFLPGRGKPIPLSVDDRRLIQPFFRNSGITPLVPLEFDENALVVVKQGALMGLEGRIVKVDRRRRRIKVSLTLYGDGRFVDFGYTDVGKR